MREYLKTPCTALENLLAEIKSRFPDFKFQTAEPLVESTILDDQLVVEWIRLAGHASKSFPHRLKYLVYKTTCGETHDRETIETTRVSLFDPLSPRLTNSFQSVYDAVVSASRTPCRPLEDWFGQQEAQVLPETLPTSHHPPRPEKMVVEPPYQLEPDLQADRSERMSPVSLFSVFSKEEVMS